MKTDKKYNSKIQNELLKLLKKLVSIDTSYPPANTKLFDQFIRQYLKGSELTINSYFKQDKNKLNTVIKNYNGFQKSLVFNSHIDTVKPIKEEWNTDPYKLIVKNKHSTGLGSVNCKSSAAVHLYIAKNFKKLFPKFKSNIAFTFVADEENLGPEGTLFLKQKKIINPHTLILGAPTNNNMLIEERGVFWAKVDLFGKTSHAGEPEKGINSIVQTAKLINLIENVYKKSLKKFNVGFHKSTISIGIISGGENINVVPYKTTFMIDRRITHRETIQKSFNDLKKFILKHFSNAKISFMTGTNPFKSDSKNKYLVSLKEAFRLIYKKNPKYLSSIGVSDGRYFADQKVNIINIGPGTGEEGHRSNEKLINDDLINYYLILHSFLKNIQGK